MLFFPGVDRVDLKPPTGPEPAFALEAQAVAPALPGAEVVAVPPAGLLARIAAFDVALLRHLSRRTLHPAATLPLVALVRVGDGWIWAMVAILLWWAFPMAQVQQVVIHCLAAIAVSLAIYWPVKLLVRRTRPHESGLGITARVPPLDKYSFPSGHTMNNLAVSLTLAWHLPGVPGLILLAVGLPLVLGCLRVVFGVHYLSDITGGAALGGLSFALAHAAMSAFGAG